MSDETKANGESSGEARGRTTSVSVWRGRTEASSDGTSVTISRGVGISVGGTGKIDPKELRRRLDELERELDDEAGGGSDS